MLMDLISALFPCFWGKAYLCPQGELPSRIFTVGYIMIHILQNYFSKIFQSKLDHPYFTSPKPKYRSMTSQHVAGFSIREESDNIFLLPAIRFFCMQILVFLPKIFCQILIYTYMTPLGPNMEMWRHNRWPNFQLGENLI